MSTDVQICNMALGHLGIGKQIASLTEKSAEAAACNRFYEQSRDEVLRDFPWPFATKILALGLIEEDPNDEWDFSYRYPSDCMNFRRILSGTRNDSRQTRVSYRLANDVSGRLIYTDEEDAVGEYTEHVTDTALFPPDFVSTVSMILAAYIAPGLTAGDPFKMGERAIKLYEYQRNKAQGNATNEEQNEEQPDSEFIRERG